MARPLRIAFPGALYHLTSRGNERRMIFRDDIDRHHFLRILALTIERFNWCCFSYCLMKNHFHLLVETLSANVSQGMHYLNSLYTQHFNWRHKRVGHLFQGRFKGIIVDKESYFLELCRYIVLNPVRAGICEFAADYSWSSYRATIGLASPRFLTSQPVLDRFGDNPQTAILNYAKFVEDGKTASSPWNDLKFQIYLGSEDFIQRLPTQVRPMRGVSRIHQQPIRPPLIDIVSSLEDVLLAIDSGYSQSEIGAYLGVHQTTLSRQLRA